MKNINFKKNISLVGIFVAAFLFSSTQITFAGYIYTATLPSGVVTPSPAPTTTPPTTGGGFYSLGGCKDPKAKNFDSWVTFNNGSCVYDKKNTTTTPPVTVPCIPYFTRYERQGDSSEEVLKIKKFLNDKEGESLALTQKYDFALTKAVMRFQLKYQARTLIPWNLTFPTGRWYQSTQKKANDVLGCSSSVRLDNGVTID